MTQKSILSFLFALNTLFAFAQKQPDLYGNVFELTAQNRTGNPVKGVMVKSTFANQISTNDNGVFNLTFQNGEAGLTVLLQANKDNWVVSNKEKLKLNLPKEPLKTWHRIFICRQDVWNTMNDANRALIASNIRKEYDKKYAALDKSNKNYKTLAAELEQQLTKMEEELTKYAEELSRTNLDEVTALEQKAYNLFKEGKIEECLKLRVSLESEKNLRKAITEKGQLQNSLKNTDSIIALHKHNLKEQAKLAKQLFDWETAGLKLEAIATIDTLDYDARFDYAYFLREQNQFDKAQTKYEKLLIVYKRLATVNPAVYEPDIATTKNNLGNLYKAKNDYAAAEKAFLEALEIRKRLAKQNPTLYELGVASTQNNLGILYYTKNDYTDAEKAFLEALEIYRRLAKQNPTAYEPYLATTLNNIGVLYNAKNDYTTSDKAFLEALEIYKRFTKQNPTVYEPDVARTQNNLGVLYYTKNDYTAAEKAFLEALEIYTRLAKQNPTAYEPVVATTLNNIGVLYKAKNEYTAAEKAYLEALEIRKRLAKQNPTVYEPDVATTQNNLGGLYQDKNDYTAAEKACLEALEIYRRLVKQNPTAYEPYLATTLNNIGVLYQAKNDYTASDKAFLEALEIRKRLIKNDFMVYADDLANTSLAFASNHYFKNEKQSALTYFIEAFELRKKLYQTNKSDHKIKLLSNANFVFLLYKEIQDSVKTEREKLILQYEIINVRRAIAINLKLTEYVNDLGNDYGNHAWYLLLNKKYIEAEKAAKAALSPEWLKPEGYDMVVEWVNTNLALAFLLQGKYVEAEKIYLSLKDKPYNDATYKKSFLADLDEMEKNGITHKDFEKIRELLKK